MDIGTISLLVFGVVVFFGLVWFIVNIGLPRMLMTLGSRDLWWFPLRVLPPHGEYYIMVHGNPNGPFIRLLESIDEKNYDTRSDLFTNSSLPDIEMARQSGDYFAMNSLGRVGLNAYFLEREMRYEVWQQLPTEPGEPPRWGLMPKVRGVVDKKKGKPPSYYWRYSVAIWVEKAESKSDAPIDLIWNLTLEIESPRRAFFYEGGFIPKVNAAVTAESRHYVSTRTFEEMKQEEGKPGTALAAKIKELSGKSRDEEGSLRNLSGVKIVDARLEHIDFSGSKEMKEATELIEIARRRLQARTLDAEGIEKLVAAYASDPAGTVVAMSEAIREAKPTTLVMGGALPTVNVADATPKAKKGGEEK